MDSEAKKRRHDRFRDLLLAAFGPGKAGEAAAAALLNVTGTSILNWLDTSKVTQPHNLVDHLKMLGATLADLDGSDEEAWRNILRAAPACVAAASGHARPGWMYTGGQIGILEKYVRPGEQIVVITDDAYNDTMVPDVYKEVEDNLRDGVHYLYVVPSTCVHLSELKDAVAASRARAKDVQNVGTVNIMRVNRADGDLEWGIIDHILITLTEVIKQQGKSFENLTYRDIGACFEQVYKLGEMSDGDRIWLATPVRKQHALLLLLRRWEQQAEWLF